jgi:predicted phosphoribosyltransferase
MTAAFRNRSDAGRQLAARLRRLAGQPDLVVLGLPRGGVPVAAEVAEALGARLDVFVVRKLGAPGHPELAMGAVASGGVRVVEQDVVRQLHVTRQAFDQATEQELREVERRERAYRDARPLPELTGATVVLVDDGAATGATMLAAVYALRQLGPARVIAAAPVMSRQAHRILTEAADQCECVAVPEPFYGVGIHYLDFQQTTDDEVRTVLRRFGSSAERSVLHADPH